MPARIRFTVLGPVRAWRGDEPVDAGPARQRAVLAVLLLHPGRPMSPAKILDAVWGVSHPASGEAVVHTYTSRLRRALGEEASLTRTRGGYLLELERDQLDLTTVEDELARADKARADGDWGRATELLESVLQRWEPEALAGLPGEFAENRRASLAEQRLAVVETRLDVELHRGGHARLVPELTTLVADHPLRERPLGMLMLALHRAGRQAEALGHFQRARKRFADELGIDLGSELRGLYQRILADDSALALSRAKMPARKELPATTGDFTGRDDELERLLHGAARIVAIDGMAGVGKTALALHAAHLIADRYPDGQLFLDLHGHTAGQRPMEPVAALGVLLRAMGLPGERIPDTVDERTVLWRSTLAERRVLLVLDNAASTAQIRSLLPGDAGSFVLVTSRRRMSEIDTLPLDVLPGADAAALLARIIGPDRAAAEPEALAEVAALCAYLPLALRIAGARLRSRPGWTVAYLAGRLREGRRLTELATGDRSVDGAFNVSYRQLNPDQQRLFLLLGLPPASTVDRHSAAALLGADPEQTEDLLEELLDVHLVHQPGLGRYELHDLVREHAWTVAHDVIPAEQRRDAIHGLLGHYLHTASMAMDLLAPHERHHRPSAGAVSRFTDRAEALAWLEAERPNLLAAAEWDTGTYAVRLSVTIARYLSTGGYYDQALRLHTLALEAKESTAWASHHLGTVHMRLARYDEALARYRDALAIAQETGDRALEGATVNNLGVVHARASRADEALDHYRRALAIAHDTGDATMRGDALHNLGQHSRRADRYEEALAYYQQALDCDAETGFRAGEGSSLNNLGLVHSRLGHYDEALPHFRRALVIADETGENALRGATLNNLGDTATAMGDPARALGHHADALEVAEGSGDRYEQARAHRGLATAHRALGHLKDAERQEQRAATLALPTGSG